MLPPEPELSESRGWRWTGRDRRVDGWTYGRLIPILILVTNHIMTCSQVVTNVPLNKKS